MMPIKQKVGDKYTTKFNGIVEVVHIENSQKIWVQFLDTGYIRTCRASSLKSGNVKDPYRKLDIAGFVGEGKFSWSTHKNIYQAWRNMLRRCYDPKSERYSCYGGRGVTVCESWHNFQNFCSWWISELKVIPAQLHHQLEIDKDYLKQSSSSYNPESCKLIPKELNKFLSQSALSGIVPNWREGNSYRIRGYDGKSKNFKNPRDAETYWRHQISIKAKGLRDKYQHIDYLTDIINKLEDFIQYDKVEADTYEQILDKQRIK